MSQTPVVAAVIEKGGSFLLCRRPPYKGNGGTWEFPGGEFEDGESLQDATRRELSQELGIETASVGPIRLSVADPDTNSLIQFVEVEIEGEPRPLEHSSIAWVRSSDLLGLPLAPWDRTFAKILLRQMRY